MFDLTTAYGRTGLTVSPTNDALLTGALNAALALVENYLNRLLLYRTQTVEVLEVRYDKIQLLRFPVAAVTSIGLDSGAPYSGKWTLHNHAGIIVFDNYVVQRRITVAYAGGYRILPADLELALWMTFDAAYSSVQGGATVQAGAIESVTVPDVGTVRFSSGANAAAAGGNSLIPATGIAILDPYRLVVC